MKHIALVVVLAACSGGSGGGGGTGAIGQAEADELCTASCQRDIDCGSETDPLATCVASCSADFVGWARADAVETIFACVAELPCGSGDDACLNEVLPLAIHEEWEAGCRAELAECIPADELDAACEVSQVGTSDVGFFRFIAPEIMEEVIACLDAAVCEDRLSCVEGVLESHNIDF